MTTTASPTETQIRRSEGPALPADGDLPPEQHFINGEFRAGSSGRFIDVVDPCNGSVFARVPEGTAADVDVAVTAARSAQPAWGALTPKERAAVLLEIADRVEQNANLLERLESANAGKPNAVSQDDVSSTVDTFRFMAGAARSITSQAAADYTADHLSVIIREPLGVIGVVTPWNYPLLMAAWKLAPILAAGNTVVLKPSEQTPLTTLKFAELVADLLPAGVLNIVTGYGPEVGGRLSTHPDLDMIALTGSVASGRAVAKAAAESLKRVHLELGGKAPVLVFADADLAAAATSLRAAGYWNSGQECGAGCRVLVHSSVADEFVDHLVREVSTLVVGEPGAGDDVEIGPMVSKAHFDRVSGFLERAAAAGIRAAVGGAPLDGPGYFIPPTVLVDVPATPSSPARRSSARWSPWRPSTKRTKPSAAPTKSPTASPHRCSPRTPAADTTSPTSSTSAPSGSTPTWSWPPRRRGAVSRAPATAGTCPSTPSTTTPAPSTSCTTTDADLTRSPRSMHPAGCRAWLLSPDRGKWSLTASNLPR